MALNVKLMQDLDLRGKRVLIREDLNVPVKDGAVTSDARIRAALPTIEAARDAGAKVILMSHLGRPTEGEFDAQFSMAPVADHLAGLLGSKVTLVEDWRLGVELNEGEVALLENVRFNPGEKRMMKHWRAPMPGCVTCLLWTPLALPTGRRPLPTAWQNMHRVACAGPLLAGELQALEQALSDPARPMVAIVGGSKVSTKLTVLETLSEKVDQLVVGGGIANTFLAAAGLPVGNSLCEHDLLPAARALMAKDHYPAARGCGDRQRIFRERSGHHESRRGCAG